MSMQPPSPGVTRLALVLSFALCVSFLIARMVELMSGHVPTEELTLIFQAVVSATLGLLVYIVHQEARK